jgi:glycosyltransferase involved in cell wall biosynthesis
MNGKDIIMIANQPWDYALGSNCKNIAEELAKNNRVLHVNPPVDRKVLLTKSDEGWVKKAKAVLEGKIAPLEKVQDNVWVLTPAVVVESINKIPIAFIHDVFNRINSWKFSNAIRKSLRELDFKNTIIFNDNVIARAFYLKEMLRPSLHIYYIRDYLVSQPYYKKHGIRLERKLIEKSDIIVANSLFLRDYASGFNPNSHYVGQGCELNIFNHKAKWPKPTELQTLNGPVIGYIGYLTSLRLDISLIHFIAKSKPDWNIVLVGPEDKAFKESKLHQLKNVVFTGNKNSDELQKYVQHFDICINPQLINDLTIGNYPRKIDEYLAMGKPTVATRTKAMEVFSAYCYLASNKEEYLNMISQALVEDSGDKQQSRIEFAAYHNWGQNVKDMGSVIIENTHLKEEHNIAMTTT